jgi:UDP-N-acetylmuramate dehydrogenase
MITLIPNQSLKSYNTFGIDCSSKLFCEVNSQEEILELISSEAFKSNQILILGGGSNILLTQNFEGLTVKNSIKGIEKIDENLEHILLKAGGGEVWHDFVMYAVNHNWAGVENLSLIPGTVGAAPMQNIGAYGVEIKDVFHSLEAIEIATGNLKTFLRDECKFGYRESVFKHELKNQFFITSVTFKLSKNPKFNTSYGAIAQTLENNGIKELSVKAISDAVIAIRQSKLPNPKKLGNSGSFFKNPEISTELAANLKANYPDIPLYPINSSTTKVAAGWLIEQCGWKGKIVGNTGAHKDQALVLVNYGNASGSEIYNLSLEIKASVKLKFGVDINPEVNII